jgi:hypothetical protein
VTEGEWQDGLRRMDEHERLILLWEPAEPDPAAVRCVHSRHRTLAHLRACQETWLEACLAFHQRPNSSLKLPHPWRLFDQRSYESVAWNDHLSAFQTDRARWKDLLRSADRTKGGKLNGKPSTIESLTAKLIAHEHQHLFDPR